MNNKRSLKRLLLVPALLLALVLALAVLPGIIFWSNTAASIRITNTGATRVTQIKCFMSDNKHQWTEHFEYLDPGEHVQISRHVSDLYIHSLAYRVAGTDYQTSQSGISTTGECFHLKITGPDVSTSYEPTRIPTP